MTLQKPKDVRYVDMAIWIDEHVYLDNCDDTMLFEYLYHLSNMLAYQSKLCNTYSQYDDFSIFCATFMYKRYKNPKQFITGEGKLPLIKSSLNYLKKIIYPTRMQYERQIEMTRSDKEDLYPITRDITIDNGVKRLTQIEIDDYLKNIVDIIRQQISTSPYANDKIVYNNIYISCLFTFLNSVTLSNKNKQKLKDSNKEFSVNNVFLSKLYAEEAEDSVMLYHIPESMKNYIYVLVNQVKKVISRNLLELSDVYDFQEETTKDMLAAIIGKVKE